ncbi:two-component regulator propeller domain-containing protein [Aquimarina hainanensis]|uniref:Two-component regulator propeller domain-containing protein n=1 Tax=Aquimarina hainanensis TaxID=1578017 RepID=A0ABW5N6F1_9FLAO
MQNFSSITGKSNIFFKWVLSGLIFLLLVVSCKKKEANSLIQKTVEQPAVSSYHRSSVFPQTHANLGGIVSEFVRVMYQDKKQHIWFGTNGDGLARYNGETLEQFAEETGIGTAVRSIIEAKDGTMWFGSSRGLTKYDGEKFTTYDTTAGLIDSEVWTIAIDNDQTIWVGSVGGVSKFDGKTFKTFEVPKAHIPNTKPILSEKRICDILIDIKGNIWFATDGYGISKFNGKTFKFFTKKNGLADNHVADIFEDREGNIWIGTFFGGISKYDGKSFINYTKNRVIEGMETYNFSEDTNGNIWFSAENHGVYKFDGTTFTQFTTKDGLATNTIQSIFTDAKGQLWFGTWEGISLYDGKTFMNVSEKESWTN